MLDMKINTQRVLHRVIANERSKADSSAIKNVNIHIIKSIIDKQVTKQVIVLRYKHNFY